MPGWRNTGLVDRRESTAARNPHRLHQSAGGHPRDYQSCGLRPIHPRHASGDRAGRGDGHVRLLAARSGRHAVSDRLYLVARELVEKLYYGKRLTPEERALADGAPAVAQKLLGRIARLEPVMEILAASRQSKLELPEGLVKLGAEILRLVLDYDAQIVQGHSAGVALAALRAQSGRFDNKLLENLESLVGRTAGAPEVKEVAVGRVTPGMVFMDDLYTQVGTLLVPKGFEVTETFLERARNFGPGILQEKVRVLAPAKAGG